MHKGDPTCSELGIPSHLHRNERGIDPHFEPGEHYYRRFNHPVEARAYTVRVVHEPEDCMYPHSMVQILENGSPISEIRSKPLKTKIRDAIARHTQVIKRPD